MCPRNMNANDTGQSFFILIVFNKVTPVIFGLALGATSLGSSREAAQWRAILTELSLEFLKMCKFQLCTP